MLGCPKLAIFGRGRLICVRQSKIANRESKIKQEVRRLDIAVDQAGVVSGFKPQKQLAQNPSGYIGPQRSVRADKSCEVCPFHVFHRD